MQIDLPTRCTLADAEALKAQLCEALAPAGADVTIDASAVTQVGTAVLQLLLALKGDLGAQGRALRWQSPSPAFVGAAEQLFLLHALDLPSPRS